MEQRPHSYENDEPAAGQTDGGVVLPGRPEVTSTAAAPEQPADAAVSGANRAPASETYLPVAATGDPERRPRGSPSIYVASLADYNEGKLHGTWVDMTLPIEDIELGIRQMLERSPALQADGEDYGDWAIHDFENFGASTVHEHDDLDVLHQLAMGIAEHGSAFSAWAEANDGDLERWPLFTEAYLGEFASLEAYGEHVLEEMGWQQTIDEVLPAEIARYVSVDAEKLTHDMWFGGDIQIMYQHGFGCWVFRGDV